MMTWEAPAFSLMCGSFAHVASLRYKKLEAEVSLHIHQKKRTSAFFSFSSEKLQLPQSYRPAQCQWAGSRRAQISEMDCDPATRGPGAPIFGVEVELLINDQMGKNQLNHWLAPPRNQ